MSEPAPASTPVSLAGRSVLDELRYYPPPREAADIRCAAVMVRSTTYSGVAARAVQIRQARAALADHGGSVTASWLTNTDPGKAVTVRRYISDTPECEDARTTFGRRERISYSRCRATRSVSTSWCARRSLRTRRHFDKRWAR